MDGPLNLWEKLRKSTKQISRKIRQRMCSHFDLQYRNLEHTIFCYKIRSIALISIHDPLCSDKK